MASALGWETYGGEVPKPSPSVALQGRRRPRDATAARWRAEGLSPGRYPGSVGCAPGAPWKPRGRKASPLGPQLLAKKMASGADVVC